MQPSVGMKVRRKRKYQKGIWSNITQKSGFKSNDVFTISSIVEGGLWKLTGLNNRFSGLLTFFDIIHEPKPPKADWVVRCYMYGIYQTYQHKNRDGARQQVSHLKNYHSDHASEITTYRLTTAENGGIILTPTKL